MALTSMHRHAAECLKIMANPYRILIVELLIGGPKSVGELAEACELKPHVASEHLNLMKRCNFLQSRREGRAVYYELAEPHLKELLCCIQKRFSRRKKS